MKKILAGLFMAGALFSFSSCTEYLDMTPTDRVSDKTIWATTEAAEYNVNYLYSYLIDIVNGQSGVGLTESLTDMLKYGSYGYNKHCYIPSEMSYGGSVITANYVDVYMGFWGTMYTAIRKTNFALYSLKAYGQMSEEDKLRLEAELRFLRANMYFDLTKRYKDIIIYDENMEAYTKDKELDTEAEAWDFIQQDLKFAAENLPVKAEARGRLDKGMAYAFTTRAMLYAKRYDAVLAAAQEVEKLGYVLEADYEDAVKKPINAGNKEAILQYTFSYENDVTHSLDFYYTPAGDYALIGQDGSGGGYGTPTQEMVESYEYAAGGFPDWTPWHTEEGTTVNPPYAELEPRFHATILYNGAPWKGRTIEPYINGTDGWATWRVEKEPKGKTTTGYYLKKLVDENNVNLTGSDMPISILRYAEVLLNKAEACYHLEGKAAEANAAIKAIRARVGLPYTDKAGEALWAAIRQERKVELAFEGLWYWDLRRWEVAAEKYPLGLSGYQQHGLKIEKYADGFKYTYVSVDDKDRDFSSKLYRFPMPTSELNNNAAVEQYPEWK